MKEKHAENIVLIVALLGLLVMGALSWMNLNGKHLRTAALKQLVLPSKQSGDNADKQDNSLLESDSDRSSEVNYADPDTESNEHVRTRAAASGTTTSSKKTPSRVKGEPSVVISADPENRPETPSR